MKLVWAILCAAALAGVPAFATAETSTPAAGIFTAGAIAGPAGVFAGGLFGRGTAAADAPSAPLYEGRTVYVPPYPSSLEPGYVAPGPLYAMPDDAPVRRTCRTNVYGERQCEASP